MNYCTSTIGPRPSGLNREVVPDNKQSLLRQVSLYKVHEAVCVSHDMSGL